MPGGRCSQGGANVTYTVVGGPAGAAAEIQVAFDRWNAALATLPGGAPLNIQPGGAPDFQVRFDGRSAAVISPGVTNAGLAVLPRPGGLPGLDPGSIEVASEVSRTDRCLWDDPAVPNPGGMLAGLANSALPATAAARGLDTFDVYTMVIHEAGHNIGLAPHPPGPELSELVQNGGDAFVAGLWGPGAIGGPAAADCPEPVGSRVYVDPIDALIPGPGGLGAHDRLGVRTLYSEPTFTVAAAVAIGGGAGGANRYSYTVDNTSPNETDHRLGAFQVPHGVGVACTPVAGAPAGWTGTDGALRTSWVRNAVANVIDPEDAPVVFQCDSAAAPAHANAVAGWEYPNRVMGTETFFSAIHDEFERALPTSFNPADAQTNLLSYPPLLVAPCNEICDADDDEDPDTADNCPTIFNPAQEDFDQDGDGDACDLDDDRDEVLDSAEAGVGSNPLNPDTDGDLIYDGQELAAGSSPVDPASTPEVTCDGLDDDLDGAADEQFPDGDGDGDPNCTDADDDGDGVGDFSADTSALDNCRLVPNPSQEDGDGDGLGDACDALCGSLLVTILGTPGADLLVGTAGADVVHALGGSDTVLGGGGNDVLCGGPGSDDLLGGPGRDQLFGGPGQDALFGGPGQDRLFGHGGQDSLFGNGGPDTLLGGPGQDALDGGPGIDLCEVGSSPDGDTLLNCEGTTGTP